MTAALACADGSAYGQGVRPEVIDVQAKVFAALRQLGFRETRSASCSRRAPTGGISSRCKRLRFAARSVAQDSIGASVRSEGRRDEALRDDVTVVELAHGNRLHSNEPT